MHGGRGNLKAGWGRRENEGGLWEGEEEGGNTENTTGWTKTGQDGAAGRGQAFRSCIETQYLAAEAGGREGGKEKRVCMEERGRMEGGERRDLRNGKKVGGME